MVGPIGALLDGDWKQTKTTNAIMAAPEIPVKPKAPSKQTKTTQPKKRKTTGRKTSAGRTRRATPRRSSGGGGGVSEDEFVEMVRAIQLQMRDTKDKGEEKK